MKGSDAVFVEIESISLGWFNDTYAGNERRGFRGEKSTYPCFKRV